MRAVYRRRLLGFRSRENVNPLLFESIFAGEALPTLSPRIGLRSLSSTGVSAIGILPLRSKVVAKPSTVAGASAIHDRGALPLPAAQPAIPYNALYTMECLDRTSEFVAAMQAFQQRSGTAPAELAQRRAAQLLRPIRKANPFLAAARKAAASIGDLSDFIRANQGDYTAAGRLSDTEKDRIEQEVGLFVQTCTQQIEVLEAQLSTGRAAEAAANPQAAAHLQGALRCCAGHFLVQTITPALHAFGSFAAALFCARDYVIYNCVLLSAWQRCHTDG